MTDRERAAELRDQASDHDAAAAESRDRAAEQHDVAADLRDLASQRRDTAADLRDAESDERDAKADLRDAVAEAFENSAEFTGTREELIRRALDRQHAAADRAAALSDRRAAAEDRAQARFARETAAADRAAAASARIFSQVDRRTALADRRGAAEDRRHGSLDGLTGVLMRTPGLLQLAQHVGAAHHDGFPLVVAFVDVDGLKRVNESGGHGAGDRTLVHVASTLRATLRPDDLVIRYGGDEFICVLVGANMDTATQRLAMLNVLLADCEEPASVSYGLAELQPGETSDSLLTRADNALSVTRSTERSLYVLDQLTTPQASQFASQLQEALDTRITIEQAKGMIAEYAGIDVDEALAAIRTYAQNNQIRLNKVAARLVTRTISTSTVIPEGGTQQGEPRLEGLPDQSARRPPFPQPRMS